MSLAFPDEPFFNEATLLLSCPASELIKEGRKDGLHVGVAVGNRLPNPSENLIKISFSDKSISNACERLLNFFQKIRASNREFGIRKGAALFAPAQRHSWSSLLLPASNPRLLPDTREPECQPRKNVLSAGLCTMKYNPYINDWAASLPGFTDAHPQAPVEDVQDASRFSSTSKTGLSASLVFKQLRPNRLQVLRANWLDSKMFQAYHEANGDENRDVVLIPKSAHGTNFATATTAGLWEDETVMVVPQASSISKQTRIRSDRH